MTTYHKSVTRHKILTALTLMMFSVATMAPPAFGNPKPIAVIPEPTISRVRLQVDAEDRETLALVRSLHVPFDITVAPGGNVQTAINAALLGQSIVLQSGAAYPANLTLPVKTGVGEITIRSSRASELPEGKRVSPAQSALFAKLQSVTNAEPVIKTASGAHGYKFIGVEITTATPDVFVYDFVRFGGGRDTQKTVESVPRGLAFDRSYAHGWPTQDSQAGVTMNCADCWVTNSYISDIHTVGIEAQAIRGWNGTNGAHVINNYLEAAGENIMFGGADSATAELMPANIDILRNYLFKPLSWKVGDPSFVPVMRVENGVPVAWHWTVKNLLEVKAARNVVIDGNVIRNNWTDAQSGNAVLFTVRNQECTAPWSTVTLVKFTNNTLDKNDGALNFLGKDNEAEPTYEDRPGHPKCSDPGESFGSIRGTDATVSNNLFYNTNGPWLLLNGFNNLTISRNTHVQQGNLMTLNGEQSQGFRYIDNLTRDHDYSIFGDGGTIGVDALNKFTPGSSVTGNVVGDPKSNWPSGNQLLGSLTLPEDFRSPFPGKGMDLDVLLAAQSGVIGTPTPTPTPTVTPTPTPSPSPTPSVCTMTVSNPVIPQWSSGKLVVTFTGLTQSGTVSVSAISGQVFVNSPSTKAVAPTSVIAEFGLQTKKKSSSVIVNGPCGSKSVVVNVQ